MFAPTTPVTRAQAASLLARALALPASPADAFSDDAGSVHENAINALAAAGVTTGCGAGRFCPDDPMTRGQMASFLVRALAIPGADTDAFADDRSDMHEAAINALAAVGITTGCDSDRFCPADPVTRGQAASFLARALSPKVP